MDPLNDFMVSIHFLPILHGFDHDFQSVLSYCWPTCVGSSNVAVLLSSSMHVIVHHAYFDVIK